MTAPALAEATTRASDAAPEQWPSRPLLDGRYRRCGAVVRALTHRLLWAPLLWLCAGRVRVAGRVPPGPVVLVANHASHADTVVVRRAVGARARRRLAVAAADDYFFSTPARARAFTAAIGAVPFPRRGGAGLRRVADLLGRGWSVLLFPQGTRNPGAAFRPGVLRLSDAGWTVVPVGIAGTERVLPKGARRPRRHRIAVVVGTPLHPTDVAGDLAVVRGAVEAAADQAHQLAAR